MIYRVAVFANKCGHQGFVYFRRSVDVEDHRQQVEGDCSCGASECYVYTACERIKVKSPLSLQDAVELLQKYAGGVELS